MKKLFIFLALIISLQGFGQTVITSSTTVLRVYDSNQPLNIETTCELWLDGKDDDSFTLDGTSVDQWDDKSGNDRHLNNTNDNTTRPTYDINTGRVAFTAANETFLQSAAFGAALVQPNTIFVVYKINTYIGSSVVFTGAINYVQFTMATGNFRLKAGVSLTDGPTNLNDNIHVALFNGASSEYWINGINVISGNAGNRILNGITLGSLRTTASAFSSAEIMEVIVYNSDISDTDRDVITAYLADKWDITATTDFKGYVLYEMMWLILLLIPNIRRKEEEFKIAA